MGRGARSSDAGRSQAACSGRSAAIGPEIRHRPTTQSRPWRLAGAELPAVLHRPDDFVGRQCDVAAGDHLRRPCPWHLQRFGYVLAPAPPLVVFLLVGGLADRLGGIFVMLGADGIRFAHQAALAGWCSPAAPLCGGSSRSGRWSGSDGAVLPRVHGACARGRERQPAPGGNWPERPRRIGSLILGLIAG